MQPSVAQHEAAGVVELVHEREIMGGDDDRRSRAIQLGEKAQEAQNNAVRVK
jgi:hypothetical protein